MAIDTLTPPRADSLGLNDMHTFRRAIGLRAIVVTEEDFIGDDDVDPVDPTVALASLAIEIGKVTREKVITEFRLRDWKAKMTNGILASEPKLAEWKVRARIEAEPVWLATKERLSELDAVLTTLEVLADAARR